MKLILDCSSDKALTNCAADKLIVTCPGVCNGQCDTSYVVTFDWAVKYSDGHTSSGTYTGTATWDAFWESWRINVVLETDGTYGDLTLVLQKICAGENVDWSYDSGGGGGGGVDTVHRATGSGPCPVGTWDDSAYYATDDLYHLIITGLTYS